MSATRAIFMAKKVEDMTRVKRKMFLSGELETVE